MTGLRSAITGYFPNGIQAYLRRIGRRYDQAVGARKAHARPGVAIMLHVGRCGSTVLANLLEQNPGIHWDGKLHRKAQGLYGDAMRDMDQIAWLQRQFRISGDRFYGFEFKILADQYPSITGITMSDFLDQCKDIGVTHYILLVRHNTLRHVISHYASINRGAWHFGGDHKVSAQQFTLDLNDITTGTEAGRPLLTYLREVEEAHDMVRQRLAGQALLEVSYEADIDEKGADYGYKKICSFMNLQPQEVTIRNRRANPFPMSDTLLNYDAIVQELTGTEFEWMLET